MPYGLGTYRLGTYGLGRPLLIKAARLHGTSSWLVATIGRLASEAKAAPGVGVSRFEKVFGALVPGHVPVLEVLTCQPGRLR